MWRREKGLHIFRTYIFVGCKILSCIQFDQVSGRKEIWQLKRRELKGRESRLQSFEIIYILNALSFSQNFLDENEENLWWLVPTNSMKMFTKLTCSNCIKDYFYSGVSPFIIQSFNKSSNIHWNGKWYPFIIIQPNQWYKQYKWIRLGNGSIHLNVVLQLFNFFSMDGVLFLSFFLPLISVIFSLFLYSISNRGERRRLFDMNHMVGNCSLSFKGNDTLSEVIK